MDITKKLVLIGLGIGVSFWIIETFLEVFLFYQRGNFLYHIFPPEPHIIWHRLMVIALLVVFVIFAHLSIKKLRESIYAMRKERDKAQKYLDVAGVMIAVIHADQRVILINKKGSEILGYHEKEIVGKNWFDSFIPERYRRDVKDVFKKLMRGEIAPFEYYENPVLTKSGKERIIAWHNSMLRDERDTIISILCSGEDITDRKLAEQSLQKRERFLSSVFSSIQDNLYVTDTEMNIIRVNQTVERMFSHAMPLVGRKCYEAFHSRNEPCEVCPTRKTLRTGKSAFEVVTLKNHDNEIIGWFDVYSFPLKDDEDGEIKGVIEYGRNVTERKRAEKELIRMEKMSSLGKMLGAIGHEIKNPLAGIGMLLNSLQSSFGKEDIRRDDITKILNKIRSLEEMLDNVVKFSRPKSLIFERADITVSIEHSLVFVNKALKDKNIRVEKTYDHNSVDISIDSESMQQVFINLFLNAIESMDYNGVLNIRVDEVKNSTLHAPGIQVIVKDTGCGIKKKDLDKIFDPYFTSNSRKTGLGLYITHQIMSKHKGHIDIYSTEGEGTSFVLTLPLCSDIN